MKVDSLKNKIKNLRPKNHFLIPVDRWVIFGTTVAIVFGAVFLVSAWQNPTSAPPLGNLYQPVNVGPTPQVKAGSLGIGSMSSVTSTAILQLDSNSKGFLLPRMTTAERDAISNPSTGLLIYNTTQNKINRWDGIEWGEVGGVGWAANGNDIYNTNSANVGIGTGTSTLSYKLDILGGLRTTATSTFSGRVGIGIATPLESLQVNGNIKLTSTGAGYILPNSAGGCSKIYVDTNAEIRSSPVDCTTGAFSGLEVYSSGYRWAGGSYSASCEDYRLASGYNNEGNGVYWIDPNGGSSADVFRVFCEMTTDGGGWTFFAHVNNNYVGSTLFTANVGTYRTDRSDDNTTYSLGASILPYISHTEMMVTLDMSDPALADVANKLVYFQYTVGNLGFNYGPVPCSGLVAFNYRITLTGPWSSGGNSTYCNTVGWYTYNVSAQYLVLFNNGSTYANYWGAGIGGDNTWYHDGWYYVR